MARITPIATNFTAGELSPRVNSRIDIAKYNSGLKVAENVTLLIHGGARRRPGTRFVSEVKESANHTRLIEFVFNRDQAYMLEFGNLYMRLYKDGAPVDAGASRYEIVTPYTSAMLPDLAYVQGADTMFLVHPEVPVHRLQRWADAEWRLLPAPFTVEPFDELGHTPAAALTLSAATVGVGRTFTSTGQFLASDVGRDIVSGSGSAKITAYIGVNSVTCEIKSAFSGTSIASGAWTITASPQATLTPSAFEPVGASVTFDSFASSLDPARANTGLSWSGGLATVTVVGHGYSSGNRVVVSGSWPSGYNATTNITVVNADTFTYPVTTNPGSVFLLGTSARIVSAPLSGVWRAADVGKYVKINGGLVKIDQVNSATSATGTIAQVLTSAVAAIPNSWTLNSSVWNAANGYPRSVTLHEQRLCLGGSPGYPQTVWGSRVGDVLNFELGTKDADAYAYELSTSIIAPIQHLATASRLMVMTNYNEMTMRGGVEKPISPTSLQKKDESTAGANKVRPVKVGNELLFVQRAARKVRALGYRYDIDGFDAPDRTVFSEHITGPGIVDMTFQQEPDAQLYCVRADGQLAVCTYDMGQEVTGWCRWTTNGVIESVASIPTSDGEQTWLIVRRNINGLERRYVEYFDEALKTDCAVTATDAFGETVWDVAHLQGMTVQAIADGVYQGEFLNTSASVELSRPALATEFGLAYTPRMQLLNPEVGSSAGTSQGAAISVGEVIVRVLDTAAVVINGQVKTFRRMDGELLDRPPAIGSGDLRETTLSDAIYRNELVIEQPQPVDFHVLAVIRKCTVND